MSKPNFRTNLPWGKALELLNKLVEHMIDTESDGEVVYYITCEINEKTKNWLTNLGVDLNKLGEDFYNPEDGWFDLMPIWDEIQSHYGHNLYYTGKEFVVWDEEKEQLLKAANKVINENNDIPVNGIDELLDAVIAIEDWDGDLDG